MKKLLCFLLVAELACASTDETQLEIETQLESIRKALTSHAIALSAIEPRLQTERKERLQGFLENFLKDILSETEQLRLGAAGAGSASSSSPARSLSTVPPIAVGHEEAYRQFLNGVLVYKPNKENDIGKIELPIRALANQLEGTFDLSACGGTGKYISIHTGYKKAKIPVNADKVEIWFMPKFLVEANIGGDASWLSGEMSSFDAPYGIVWTWGGWDVKSDNFDYLLSGEILMDKSKNLYEKWRRRIATFCWHATGKLLAFYFRI